MSAYADITMNESRLLRTVGAPAIADCIRNPGYCPTYAYSLARAISMNPLCKHAGFMAAAQDFHSKKWGMEYAINKDNSEYIFAGRGKGTGLVWIIKKIQEILLITIITGSKASNNKSFRGYYHVIFKKNSISYISSGFTVSIAFQKSGSDK